MDDQQRPDQQRPVEQNAQKEPKLHDFERLTDGLKTALRKFQDDQTPENFAVIVSALSEFGISGADVWHQVATYSKRHPIRVGLFAGLVFFALKGLAPVVKVRRLQSSTMH